MKVLLISANRSAYPYPVFPIGLDHVAEALSTGHEVRLLDLCPIPESDLGEELDSAVRAFEPDAIGLSIRNIDNNDATAVQAFFSPLCAIVRRLRSATRAPLVLGGAAFSTFPDHLMRLLDADYGVVGDGEQARALFDTLAAHGSPEGLPGVAVRGRTAPRSNPTAPPPGRVSPRQNNALQFYLARGGILNLQTQRGCPFKCAYCAYPGIEGRTMRSLAPDSVAQVALHLKEVGAKHLVLTDSSFNADPAHAEAVAEAFLRANVRISWGAFFTPTLPPENFYARMARADCTHVEFGTDALSDVMLARLRKPFRAADALAAHRSARAAGLHVAHFFLLGGPGESIRTLDETLDAAESLSDAALFFFCGMRVYPGTEIERIARREGQLDGRNLLEPVFYEPPELPLAEIAARVEARGSRFPNWIVGSGAERAAALVARMHQRGHSGPLWENLVA